MSTANGGHIIDTFGTWVTRGNYVVGAVIFVILVAVNYIVIANGTQRIGEVAARFTLDAMPGKQMSIDADLTNGLINEDQARERRRKLEQEADYYGAMDGASRYVRGDAIVGIIIAIAITGAGFIVGMVQLGMSASLSVQTYTRLTIGEGLVAQLPALLMSVAAGVMVTNAASDKNVSINIMQQISAKPKTLTMAAGIIGLIAIVPGMPKLLLFPMAAAIYYLGARIQKNQARTAEALASRATKTEVRPSKETPEEVLKSMTVDPMQIEIGFARAFWSIRNRKEICSTGLRLYVNKLRTSLGLSFRRSESATNTIASERICREDSRKHGGVAGTDDRPSSCDQPRHRWRGDSRHSDKGAGLRISGVLDHRGGPSARRGAWIHCGRSGQRSGDAFIGDYSFACR